MINQITFAKLHTIQSDVLTAQNLEEIMTELKLHHDIGEILKFSFIQSCYSEIQTNCFFHEKKSYLFNFQPQHFSIFSLIPDIKRSLTTKYFLGSTRESILIS